MTAASVTPWETKMAVTSKSMKQMIQQHGDHTIPTPGWLYAERTLPLKTSCVYTGTNGVADSSIALKFHTRNSVTKASKNILMKHFGAMALFLMVK